MDKKLMGVRRLSQEGQLLDKKSLRSVTGKSVDWKELVKDGKLLAEGVKSGIRYRLP
jgi:hypothetical protein